MELNLDLPKGATVLGRDERLGQVIRNLIDNAVSFSPDGSSITISVHAENRIARIVIEDRGPGIPPDNLESIFERLYTERPKEHGFGKNSGLGLSIARQIVVSHGGRIWAENRKRRRRTGFHRRTSHWRDRPNGNTLGQRSRELRASWHARELHSALLGRLAFYFWEKAVPENRTLRSG